MGVGSLLLELGRSTTVVRGGAKSDMPMTKGTRRCSAPTVHSTASSTRPTGKPLLTAQDISPVLSSVLQTGLTVVEPELAAKAELLAAGQHNSGKCKKVDRQKAHKKSHV